MVAIGLLPAIAWKGLSLFYYGFPLPNTAYAKVLNTGLDKIVLVQQGLSYFENLMRWHPLTFFIIMIGISIPFIIKEKRLIPIVLGIIFYLIFIIESGGDFMSGRYFSAPLFVAVILLSQCNFTAFRRVPLVILSMIVIVVGVITPNSPLFSDENYVLLPEFSKLMGDERAWYYPDLGLLNNLPMDESHYNYWAKKGLESKESDETTHVIRIIGMSGFYAGPNVHIIDNFAIGDSLLSKLPLTERNDIFEKREEGWRIGHYYRTIPPGYFETIQSGENMIEDKCLARYYDKLSIMTRGNLFDPNRIQEIWNMNTGKYDYLLDSYIHKKGGCILK